MDLLHLFRCSWKAVSDNGKTVYAVCSHCGERRITQRPDGYQPIDRKWLETGEFSTPRMRPILSP